MIIYVGNLTYNTTEAALRTAFEEFGEVESVRIMKDKATGQSRGFAFVTMPNNDEAQSSIDGLNGQNFEGRPLRINEARPREEGAQRPAGAGGFSGPRSGGYSRPAGGPGAGGFGGPRRDSYGNGGGSRGGFGGGMGGNRGGGKRWDE